MKPILFNTEMVRAILDGRKTVTRRAVKYKYSNTEMKMRTDKYGTRLIEIQKDVKGETFGKNPDGSTWHKLLGYIEPKSPYQPGDILYVRETWGFQKCSNCENCTNCINAGFEDIYKDDEGCFVYRTDYGTTKDDTFPPFSHKWHPSIHMPKEAARIFLRVTDVRAERLQDITNKEAKREGVTVETDNSGMMHRVGFARLWDSVQRKSNLERCGWNANPWVWAIEFERMQNEE